MGTPDAVGASLHHLDLPRVLGGHGGCIDGVCHPTHSRDARRDADESRRHRRALTRSRGIWGVPHHADRAVCIIVITVLICHTAIYETGFLDDRPASDWFRFPLCVRAIKVQRGDRDARSGGIAPEGVAAATSYRT